MGIWDSIRGLFSAGAEAEGGGTLSVAELARRLGVSEAELRGIRPSYRSFQIPKRAGGYRTILEPDERLKKVQRLILRRLLKRLRSHTAAHGFERGRSIVTGANPHAGKSVVLRMDVEEFFSSTKAARVEKYFRKVGWGSEAAALLARLCTRGGSLPQGAPTSPRLSNLVNFQLDARLSALARKCGADYTRYADDMTFSFASEDSGQIRLVIRVTKEVLLDSGYRLHTRKKLRIFRRHDRQTVTGLVVNERVLLPRPTRRRLRAVEHRASLEWQQPTLTPAQLAGWRSLRKMIAEQSKAGGDS